MSEAEIYASISDYELMLEALDERRKELGISCSELDDLAGIAAGYFSKCAGASQVKRLGWKSALLVARALGLRLTLEIDPDATAATLAAARRRNANQARPNNFAARPGKRALQRAMRHINKFSWSDILKAIHAAKKAGAEQAEQTVKAARKAAIEANKQPPASNEGRCNGKAHGAAKRPVPPAAGAFDAPMVEAMREFEEIAEASSIRVSRKADERRGSKRPRVSAPFPPMDQHAINRRTQTMLLSKHAKPVSVAP